MKKVIVAHPAKQHSFELATALKEQGILYKYITTVYDKPGSIVNFMTRKILKGKDLKKASSRRCNCLNDEDVIQYNELFALITIFLSRIPKLRKLYIYWDIWVASNFYKKVMKYAKKHNVDAVIYYDGTEDKHLEILDNSKIIKIMDVSIAHKITLRKDFELGCTKEALNNLKKEDFVYWNENIVGMDLKSVKKTDYFITASNYVKNSLSNDCGINENKIEIIPYGVDINKFKPKKIYNSEKRKLKLIYVGLIIPRKGLHRLIDVIKRFDKSEVELYLVGSYSMNAQLYKNNKDIKNIHFMGFITRDELSEMYNQCDVFVFPTLGEGFGMVVLEALACGLPVICSNRAGGNDIITDGESGIVYDSTNDDELYLSIKWFIENQNKLQYMGLNARKTAEQYTWDRYHKNILEYLQRI